MRYQAAPSSPNYEEHYPSGFSSNSTERPISPQATRRSSFYKRTSDFSLNIHNRTVSVRVPERVNNLPIRTRKQSNLLSAQERRSFDDSSVDILRRDSGIDVDADEVESSEELKLHRVNVEDSYETSTLSYSTDLDSHLETVVCVVGVGYVGTELLSAFGRVFTSIGFDVSQDRLNHIKPEFEHLEKVTLTSDASQLSRGTHYLISVPTNLHKDNSVDATHLKTAIQMVTSCARPGSTIVIESSVSVGMTRSLLAKYKGILNCGMSPERVDPGRVSPTLVEIPKVISALDAESLDNINDIYSQVFQKVVPVSRPEVAEMVKLYENCYRMINIAYVNEIADACVAKGMDPNEVIDAASTKPFGFQAFRPGLGVGGHCIPINPYYLLTNNTLPVLEHSAQRMAGRPRKLATEIHEEHSQNLAPHQRLRVLVVGIAFKPGQDVISCSPGLSFAAAMSDLGCESLKFYDPLVSQKNVVWMDKLETGSFNSSHLDANFDLVVICMRQTGVDFGVLGDLEHAKVKYFFNSN
ncbi:nucleotide sugar dehydrogenase [Phlyctema vagabunda]|uniref:Nucleotide sugar dehydrogenase n=1 Tax=Phlyctema vagabunda TaxID=108571 RepID=A0ABR4PE73_9HELO